VLLGQHLVNQAEVVHLTLELALEFCDALKVLGGRRLRRLFLHQVVELVPQICYFFVKIRLRLRRGGEGWKAAASVKMRTRDTANVAVTKGIDTFGSAGSRGKEPRYLLSFNESIGVFHVRAGTGEDGLQHVCVVVVRLELVINLRASSGNFEKR
jgi:hypothetical protein